MTPLQLLDIQKSQTILSHFDGVFGVFMSNLQLFDPFLPTFSHFHFRKWRPDLSAVDSSMHEAVVMWCEGPILPKNHRIKAR